MTCNLLDRFLIQTKPTLHMPLFQTGPPTLPIPLFQTGPLSPISSPISSHSPSTFLSQLSPTLSLDRLSPLSCHSPLFSVPTVSRSSLKLCLEAGAQAVNYICWLVDKGSYYNKDSKIWKVINFCFSLKIRVLYNKLFLCRLI